MSGELTGSVHAGWLAGATTSVRYKGKFVTLYQCTRACRDCGTEMRMNFSQAVLRGEKKNNGLAISRCNQCRDARKAGSTAPVPAADDIKTVEASAPATPQPQDAIVYLIQRNEALTIENAELKAAAKFAAPPTPTIAATVQAPAPGADTAELEELRKFRLDVFKASQCFEYGPVYVNAAGSKTRDRLGPEQVTNATLLEHVKEVGKLYIGAWRIFSGFEDVQVALHNVSYAQAYVSAASLTLDNSVRNRISSEARDEADAKYPLE